MAYCSLRWEEHLTHTRDTLSDAWFTRSHADITVTAENQVIECHKLVLCNNIKYFRDVLSLPCAQDKHLVVDIRAPFELVNAIIMFTYLGEINIIKSQVSALLRLAEELGVGGLASKNVINRQPEECSEPASVLCAAEALQNLGNAPRLDNCQVMNQSAPIDYQTAPKQPIIMESNQPSAADQPPIQHQDPVEFHQSHHYKAAASRAPRLNSVSPPLPSKKRKLSVSTSLRDCLSPDAGSPYPSDESGSPPYIVAKQEEPDSEYSDGELQIDEGSEEPLPMQFCTEQMYMQDPEPEDLSVESRHHTIHQALQGPSHGVSGSSISSILLQPSAVFMPTSSEFASTKMSKILLGSTANSHFLDNNTGHISNVINCSAGALKELCGNGIKTITINKRLNGFSSNVINKKSSQSILLKDLQRNNGVRSPPGSKSDKSYTFADLAAAVQLVIDGKAQPVEAINKYGIPRRTFFRHLKQRRIELGIETKTRSKPTSRATSPSSVSLSNSATPPGMTTQFINYHNKNTGSHLQEILRNISSVSSTKIEPIQHIKKEVFSYEEKGCLNAEKFVFRISDVSNMNGPDSTFDNSSYADSVME